MFLFLEVGLFFSVCTLTSMHVCVCVLKYIQQIKAKHWSRGRSRSSRCKEHQ